jgi:hypothetical protein
MPFGGADATAPYKFFFNHATASGTNAGPILWVPS